MVNSKAILLIGLKIVFLACNVVVAQTEMDSDTIDIKKQCNECDSLYNRIDSARYDRPEIFGGPEVFPEFPGGDKAMMKFIAGNIIYPQECAEMCILGRVIVRFIIDETGKVICPEILRSLYPAMDKEALRVVSLMPTWKPASNNGIPLRMCYTLPVLFKLNTTEANANDKPNFFQKIFRKLFAE